MAELAEGARLLSEYGVKAPSRVRIPLSPPLYEQSRLSVDESRLCYFSKDKSNGFPLFPIYPLWTFHYFPSIRSDRIPLQPALTENPASLAADQWRQACNIAASCQFELTSLFY